MTTARTWGGPRRGFSTPAANPTAARPWTPPLVDLLHHSPAGDPEITGLAMNAATPTTDCILVVVAGRVRVAVDRQVVRGQVLATSVHRHLGDPVLDDPRQGLAVEHLATPALRESPWLHRWRPASLLALPLSVDGHTYGVLLAMSFRQPFDAATARGLRSGAEAIGLRLALREARQNTLATCAALDATQVPAVALEPGGRVRAYSEAARTSWRLTDRETLCEVVRTDPAGTWLAARDLPATPVRLTTGDLGGFTGVAFHDRSAALESAAALAHQLTLSRMLLEAIPGRVCVLDAEGIVVATNAAFDTQGPLGRGRRSAMGPGSDYLAWLETVDKALHRDLRGLMAGRRGPVRREVEITYRRRPRWTEIHAIGADDPQAAALILHIDITDRKEAELDLQHRATHDPLTGLPNRVLLVDRLQHALSRSARSHTSVGVLFCDLDRFKEINTQFGHAGGDQLLVEVSRRISAACRTSDTVARVSGDEFVVLVEDVTSPDEMEEVAGRILDALADPIALDDGEARTGASIGMALSRGIPRAGMGSVQKLVRQVDAAMYAAKDAGRNQYAWFSPEMLDKQVARPNFLETMARRFLNR